MPLNQGPFQWQKKLDDKLRQRRTHSQQEKSTLITRIIDVKATNFRVLALPACQRSCFGPTAENIIILLERRNSTKYK